MIRACRAADVPVIDSIINEAAARYRGAIPDEWIAEGEDLEHLGLQMPGLAVPAQLVRLVVELAVAEPVHARNAGHRACYRRPSRFPRSASHFWSFASNSGGTGPASRAVMVRRLVREGLLTIRDGR